MKGSKRRRWLKEGYKTSRHWYKSMWNRKIRHTACELIDGSFYKKNAKASMYDGII